MIFILPVYFKVNFRITDPDGQSSEWTPLYIRVKSRHSMAPIATENNGLILYEGQQRCIGSESLLLSDEDSAIAKMDIRVMDGMKHGNIFVRSNSENVSREKISNFATLFINMMTGKGLIIPIIIKGSTLISNESNFRN